MTAETRGSTRQLFAAALLSAAMCSTPSLAGMSADCAAIVNKASLQAVNRAPVIGQTIALGRPFAIEPSVMRAEVEVFGPQTQIYAVDVAIDRDCRVLATSTRLESESESPR
jgi:hypothetical protein